MKFCTKKTVKFFYNFDFLPVTAGGAYSFVGGIMTALYCIIIFCLVSGIMVSKIDLITSYLQSRHILHNERIEATQLAAFEHKK
jgi:hypothetical protein